MLRSCKHNCDCNYIYIYILTILISLTSISGFLLSSSRVSADDTVVDEINITVPVSCNLTGVGMNSHAATINNGTYVSDIGTTTIKAYCNDKDGFAIYAIGYTDDTDGKNVMTSSTLGSTHDIATGTGTSGNNSQWAMKLSTQTNPEPTYPVTIQNSYNNYHTVPDDYDLVAKRISSTDIGAAAIGSTLTSTYQIYISNSQSAGTYVGQVKYVMVHPNDGDTPVKSDQIAVVYEGNGLTFSGDGSTNKVVYEKACTPMYQETNPLISKSTNLNNDGTPSGSIANGDSYGDTVQKSGADYLRIVLTYDVDPEGTTIDNANGEIEVSNDDWDTYSAYYGNGTETIIIEGDTVYFWISIWGDVAENHDYGYYAQVYPLYGTEQTGTEETSVCQVDATPISGTYAETTTWKGKWYTILNGSAIWFEDENEIVDYINKHLDSILGTTMHVYSYNPYYIYYNGNGATAGTMNGFYTTIDSLSSTADLMAYNFKKTGYGFAGWSENQNATVNSNNRIYGPNEQVAANELTFNNHETTLYAIWVPSAGNLQNWSGCSSLAFGQVTALTDNRDNNVYTVGKLADGNCWMMENLRLDATNSDDSSKAQGFGGVFSGLANSEDTNFKFTNNTNSKYSASSITGNNPSFRFPRYNNNNTNIGGNNSSGISLTVTPGMWNGAQYDQNQIDEDKNNHTQWFGYGNYYTWAAAVANTSYFSDTQLEVTNTSICPSGWVLPYGSTSGNGLNNGSFSYLDTQLGGTGSWRENDEVASNRWRKYPNNFIYAGFYSDSSTVARGWIGRYWSNTQSIMYNPGGSYDNSSSYLLEFEHHHNRIGQLDFKYTGLSVRCLTH